MERLVRLLLRMVILYFMIVSKVVVVEGDGDYSGMLWVYCLYCFWFLGEVFVCIK